MDRKISYKYFLIAVSVFAVVSVVLVSFAFGKYESNVSDKDNLVSSEQFFFECDFEHGGVYLFPNESNFDFTVKNYDVFDNRNVTDITYTVKLDGVLFGEAITLRGGEKSAYRHSIGVANFNVGQNYTVTIESSAPYQKTIAFTISVVSANVKSYYSVENKGNWVCLDLYIGTEVPTALEIVYGALNPDNTNDVMRDWKTEEESSVLQNIRPYTHYTLIFFGAVDAEDVEKTELPEKIILMQNQG